MPEWKDVAPILIAVVGTLSGLLAYRWQSRKGNAEASQLIQRGATDWISEQDKRIVELQSVIHSLRGSLRAEIRSRRLSDRALIYLMRAGDCDMLEIDRAKAIRRGQVPDDGDETPITGPLFDEQ